MKTAFISDIHSNLEALEAVLADLASEGADRVVCLGDIVGYGPNPNQCVARVKETCVLTVVGNHDHAALGKMDTEYFNQFARTATDWTKDRLDDESKEFLTNLPFTAELDGHLLAHSSPLEPEVWTYVISLPEAQRQFGAYEGRFCFIGHSHLPVLFQEEAGKFMGHSFPMNMAVKLDAASRYLVNVGSVGQPRDRDPRAAYAWYDDEEDTVALRRVEYAVDRVQKKIMDAGLPQFLAVRLQDGI